MIDQIKSAPVGATLWDTGEKQSVKGLHVRIVSETRRSFYLFYRTKGGQQRKPKIGDWGEITLAQARKIAKEMLEQVAMGKDPKGEWDAVRAEPTLNQVFEKAFEPETGLWSQERYQKSGWAKEVKKYFNKHIKNSFGSNKLSEITADDIRAWHLARIDRPYAANRSLEVLSRLFTFALERNLTKVSNPCALVKAHVERKRKRYASPEEIQAVWSYLTEKEKVAPRGAAFLKVLLLTGSRPRALERARPEQLRIISDPNGDYAILTFDGKTTAETGEEEMVAIPPPALAIIRNVPPSKDGTIFGCKIPKNLWARVKAKTGCKDLWARDFRRTFATIGLSNGVSRGVISELLNQRSEQTTRIYAKLLDDARVDAANQIADKVVSITSGKRQAV